MALNEVRSWLIAYDIREKRRLLRVHRFLKQRAVPVQYSVFVAQVSANDIRRIRDGLQQIVDERVDDVRIYQLPVEPNVSTLGGRLVGAGVLLLTGSALSSVLGAA